MAKQETTKEKKMSLQAKVFSQEGAYKGEVALPEGIFSRAWNSDLVHQVVTAMMTNARQPIAHAKNRGEVSGGGKKPWQQKGTGRARHGSTRSPLWVGGGVTHGPRNDKNYSRKINKKAKAGALFSILSQKQREAEIIFLDSLSLPQAKTSEAKKVLRSLATIKGFETLSTKKHNALMIALPEHHVELTRSFRNIGNVVLSEVRNLNPINALKAKFIAFVGPEKTVAILEQKMK